MSRNHLATAVTAVAIGSLALVGCSNTSGQANSSASEGSTTSAKDLAWAKQMTERYMAGTDRALPSSGPEAVKGKNVWVISCTARGPGCQLPAEAVQAAGEKLGWKVTVVDGKIDPAVYNSAIRNAIAAKADAVMLAGVDCASTQASIKEAKDAGVVIFGMNALDCDDKYVDGGSKMFTAAMPWGPDGQDYGHFLDEDVAPAIAAWVINETKGAGNIILMTEDDNATTRHIGDSEAATLADRCGGCTVHKVPYTGADLLGGLQGKVSAALQKYPDANVVMVPIDAAITLGAAAAVEQARATGRDILLVGQEGNPANVELIRKGVQDYAVGKPMFWTGWAAADGLNRYFAGEPLVDEGIGFGSIDADHLPSSDVYDGNPKSSEYQANLLEIWGVS